MDQGLSSRGYSAVVVSWVFTSLAIVSVGLRFISAAVLRRRLRWDDFLIIIALGLEIYFAVCVQLGYVNGLGHHVTDLIATPKDLTNCVKWIHLGIVPGTLFTMCARICFAAYLLITVGKSSNWQRISIFVLIATQLLINVPMALMMIFRCGTQVITTWASAGNVDRCFPITYIFKYAYAVAAGFNVTADLYLSALPAYTVWNLPMSLRRRLVLIVLLGSTVFVAAANIVKTISIHKLGDGTDYTYNAIDVFVWISVEGSLILILGCAPIWVPLLRRRNRQVFTDANSLKLVDGDAAGDNNVSCTHGPGTPRGRTNMTRGISMTTTFKSTSEEFIIRHD